MAIKAAQVKELRNKTNAGMMDCKKALIETDGNIDKAVDILRAKGLALANKAASRDTTEGVIASYIHGNGKVGVLVEVSCETDFVAKTESFKQLVKDLTLQIASTSPLYVTRAEVPADVLEREKSIFREQVKDKPENILEKIINGKVEKYFSEICLVDQPFIKEDKKTITDIVKEVIASSGENIVIKRFTRYQIG